MKERLPIALSSAALIVALFGVTPIGSAASGAVGSLSRLSASRPSAKPRPRVLRGPRGLRGFRGPVGPRGAQGPAGTPDPSNFYNKAESDSRFASQATVAALQARIDTLEAKLAAVSYDSPNHVLRVTGANVQIVDGTGDTGGAPNGLGNVIVGYNANSGNDVRTGSHNLVVGDGHTYTSFGGLVAGVNNDVTGESASVSGGAGNTASGPGASVSGGSGNTASGHNASVSGGYIGSASGENASVSGGWGNVANDRFASVSGGASNTAAGEMASVSGGLSNTAGGNWASVSGGSSNSASGDHASVSGGGQNSAFGNNASVSGGSLNTTSNDFQWVAGTLLARQASVSVPGGVGGNGDYATRAIEAPCLPGELLLSGGGFWVSEVDDDETPLISSRANGLRNGWIARGGNDTSVARTLTAQAICLGP